MVNLLDTQHRVNSNELRAFIETYPADDDVKRPLYNAIDAYERIRQSADAVDENLYSIVSAASCKNHPVGTFGRSLLLNLVLEYPQARHAVDELIEDGNAKLRSEIVFAAGIYTPECDYKKHVIRRCLNDRASSVRKRAIESSDKSMLSELQYRQGIEKDDSLKEHLNRRVQHISGCHNIDPNSGSVKYYWFFHRDEELKEHFVVNCVLENRWLQLDVVFKNSQNELTTVLVTESGSITRGVESRLNKDKVVQSVVGGIRKENESLGTDFDVEQIHFSQSDFDCYYLYEESARRLVRQIITGGGFAKLIIQNPTT